MRTWWRRLVYVLRQSRHDAELREEIETHRALRQATLERGGLTRTEAIDASRRALGNELLAREDSRDVWLGSLESWWRDVRHAARTYGRSPTFTAVAVLTLALGIGAMTAIFSVVTGVLVRPLPYPDADRLVQIVENVPAEESPNGRASRLAAMSQDEFDWWRSAMTSFEGMAVTLPDTRTVTTTEGTIRLAGAQVSPALFALRRVRPMLGRGLVQDDEREGNVVVISTDTWRRFYGTRPDAVGRSLTMDGQAYTVVGVMPPAFGDEAFWTPIRIEAARPGAVRLVTVTAKLKEGATIDSATSEAMVVGGRLRGDVPRSGARPRFEVVRQLDHVVATARPALRLLTFAAAGVMLIVCANLTNLLLTRGASRHQEVTVRRALGARRGQIVRQLVAEGLVLSFAGGAAGCLIAWGSIQLVKRWSVIDIPDQFRMALGPLGPTILPRTDSIDLDGVALAFALAVSIAAGVLFTIAPAIRLSRVGHGSASSTPRLEMRIAASRGDRLGVGRLLAAAQLGLATMLLVGTGLLLHSFLNLTRVHLGFALETQTFQVVPPGEYPRSRKLALAYEVADRLRQLPGVSVVGFTNAPPFDTDSMRATFLPPEMEHRRGLLDRDDSSQIRAVSADYLRALGVRLVEGRWLTEGDREGRPQVVVVNRAWVQRFSPDRSPVGTVVQTAPDNAWRVVGVVDDVRLRMNDGPDGLPSIELPMVAFVDIRQITTSYGRGEIDRPGRRPDLDALLGGTHGLTFALTAGSAVDSNMARAAVADVHPALALEGFTTFGDIFAGLTGRQRFYSVLMAAFGVMAGLIAAIGVYGVLAYGMAQRIHEFGIRLALGAEPRAVRRLAMRQGAALVAIGLVSGVAGAVGVTRYLESLLFGVTPVDLPTYVSVTALFGLVALLACYVPARRATLVDPLSALRCE